MTGRKGASPAIRTRTPGELRRSRRPRAHACWDHLYAAPLWPLHGANLGTLARTCDAVGACLTVPRFPWVPEALARGNTLRKPLCTLPQTSSGGTPRTGDPLGWLAKQRERGLRIVGVELADEAVRLADLPAARQPTVMVLGHEQTGIPPEALDLLDECVAFRCSAPAPPSTSRSPDPWPCTSWPACCDRTRTGRRARAGPHPPPTTTPRPHLGFIP